MIALDSALVQFNNNYMVVDGYLEHTAKKLDQLSAQGVEVRGVTTLHRLRVVLQTKLPLWVCSLLVFYCM